VAAERRDFARGLRKRQRIRFANVEVENDLDTVLARVRAAPHLPFD